MAGIGDDLPQGVEPDIDTIMARIRERVGKPAAPSNKVVHRPVELPNSNGSVRGDIVHLGDDRDKSIIYVLELVAGLVGEMQVDLAGFEQWLGDDTERNAEVSEHLHNKWQSLS